MKRSLLTMLALCSVSGPALAETETGEVVTWKSSAKFTEVSVVGPKVNIYRRSDGTWAGMFQGVPIEITAYKDWIVGFELHLKVTRTPRFLIVDGSFRNRYVHYEWPTNPAVLESFWWSVYGSTAGYVHATGTAARAHPPMPQLALALLAVGN